MATPKQISVNGVPFTRSKNGNLIRTKAIKQGSVKQNHQCQGNCIQSSLIPINRLSKTNDKTKLCRRYTSTGTSLSPTILLKNDRLACYERQARFVPKCSAADISNPRLLSERRPMPRYPRSSQNRDLSFHTPAQPLHSGRCLRSQSHSHF
jgi:hypothetical protein